MQTGCGSRNRDALSGKELWIDGDLKCLGQSIRLRGRAYDRQELRILRIGKSLGARCCRVGVNAVTASVRR